MKLDEIDACWQQTLETLASEMDVDRWRVEESFAHGACAALAIKISERHGFPLCILGDDESYSHAFCIVAPGYGLDIWGVRSLQEIAAAWLDDDPDLRIRAVAADRLRTMEGAAYLEDNFADVPVRLAEEGLPWGNGGFRESDLGIGAAGDFAAVLHDLTGWPLRASVRCDGVIEHVWAVNDHDRAVDVNGIHGGEVPAEFISDPGRNRTISQERGEIVPDADWSRSNRFWADSLIRRHPEIFGLTRADPDHALG